MALLTKQMMGIKFVSQKWDAWITETHKKLKRRKATNAKCTAHIGKWIQENFKSEGQKAVGGGWKPLSPVTVAMRRTGKGEGSPKILQDTGQLKNRWKRFYTDQDAYIESGVEYGWKHEEGDPHNRFMGRSAPIPKRKILPTRKQIWPDIRKIYKIFLKEILR
jgi:phage gpG-like protein